MQKIPLLIILLFSVFFAGFAYAEDDAGSTKQLQDEILRLQQQIVEMQKSHDAEINTLKQQIDQLAEHVARQQATDELAALQELARAEAVKEKPSEDMIKDEIFEARGLSLQALNPEISVTGDILFSSSQKSESNPSSDFTFRTLGVHFESWLDPYTRFKAAVPVTEDETTLGEGYVTLYNLGEDLNVTIGKFRQQFGVVNRWHKHGLDQVDFPQALRRIFGDGGLNQTGISVDWLMPPAGEDSRELTFQVTDGSNDRLFGGNNRNRPSLLLHYKNYRDLSKDTYMEWGLTGLVGWNDEWDIDGGIEQNSSKTTTVLGADLTVLWEPTEKMRYRNIEWRSEAYWLIKKLLASDESGSDTVNAWGLYSYLQMKLSRTIEAGIRGDFYQPDTKDYANISSDLSLSPLAVESDSPYLWQVSPYLTWWQSPFVKFRAEYDYSNSRGIENPEHIIWLQAIFSAGPHKHERY